MSTLYKSFFNRNWTKCQPVEEIPSISIDNIADLSHVKLVRWKVHNDWVTQVIASYNVMKTTMFLLVSVFLLVQ